MANVKISALPVAASVVLADYIPCVIAAGPTTERATLTVIRTALFPAVLTTDVTGILPAANGGTGASSLPAGGLAGLTALAAGDAASVATSAAAIVTERSTARALSAITTLAASGEVSVGSLAANGVTVNAGGGTQHDVTLGAGKAVLRFSAAVDITGVSTTGVGLGSLLTIYAPTAGGDVTVFPGHVGSAVGNRFSTPSAANARITPGSAALFQLLSDGADQHWVLIFPFATY